MISPRLIPKIEWEQRLRDEFKCRPARADDIIRHPLRTAYWWENEHGYIFPVPCEKDGSIRLDDFQMVLISVAKLKPIQ